MALPEVLNKKKRLGLAAQARQRSQAAEGVAGASTGDYSGTGAAARLGQPKEEGPIRRPLGDIQVDQLNSTTPSGETRVVYRDPSTGKVLGELVGAGPGVKRLAEAGVDPSKRGTVSFIDTATAADSAAKQLELDKLQAIREGNLPIEHINTPAEQIIQAGGINSKFAQSPGSSGSTVSAPPPSTAGTTEAVLSTRQALKNLDSEITRLASKVVDASPSERKGLTVALKALQAKKDSLLDQSKQQAGEFLAAQKQQLEADRIASEANLAQQQLAQDREIKQAEIQVAKDKNELTKQLALLKNQASAEVKKEAPDTEEAFNKKLSTVANSIAKLDVPSPDKVGVLFQTVLRTDNPKEREAGIKFALGTARSLGYNAQQLQQAFPGIKRLLAVPQGKALLQGYFGKDIIDQLQQ